MKKFLMPIILLVALPGFTGCSGGGGASSGNSLVTIKVGGSGQTASIMVDGNGFPAQMKRFFRGVIKYFIPAEASAAIPVSVTEIGFTISSADMNTITRSVVVSGQEDIEETFTVPNGHSRRFLVEALNESDSVIYRGEASADLDGRATTVNIMMSAVGAYAVQEVACSWDGAPSPDEGDIDQNYDWRILYDLPWSFTFYRVSYDQVSIDSNGNVWFDYSSYDDSFSLLTTNGHGPVIAAWNEYLSSYSYGEYKVQHKTDPERVVIEWETQTYDDYNWGCESEGNCLSNFEIVLYPDGRIRIDYNYFDYANSPSDYGSGISNGDGSNYMSITDTYGNAFTLEGRCFLFTPNL